LPQYSPSCRWRLLIPTAVLFTCCLLIFCTWGVEVVQVPTGSMAPALFGIHRETSCPCCGYPIVVGRDPRERGEGTRDWHVYDACPNCGAGGLQLDDLPEKPGDSLLINKCAFVWRQPRRWETVVFTLFGECFIKRVVALPGERVEIRGGDVYIDDQLARKSLAEVKALRIPVFDNYYVPSLDGWQSRWQTTCSPHPLVGKEIRLNALESDQWLVYRHSLRGSRQSQPIRDEYGYNGNWGTGAAVHDFMMECDMDIRQGDGSLILGIRDGRDSVVATLAVGGRGATLGSASHPWNVEQAPCIHEPPFRSNPVFSLRSGRLYHVEMAFVDRRVSFAVDGKCPFDAFDLPEPGKREPVCEPVLIGARGVSLVVRNFKLYRDIHYTQDGHNGVCGQSVRLRDDEYFVLGDNSPQSDDSRFWPDRGAVPVDRLLGKPFFIGIRPRRHR
jgi:signal peptidase I